MGKNKMEKLDYNKIEYPTLNNNIKRGLKKGIINLNEDETKISYLLKKNHNTEFRTLQELIRASYLIELVLDYKYPKENILLDYGNNKKIYSNRSDIVVFEDEEFEKPLFVVECKKNSISHEQFKQSIEQVFKIATAIGSKYAILIDGTTKTAFCVQGFKFNEREKNFISDIPKLGSNIPKCKFIKKNSSSDLKIPNYKDMTEIFEKTHNTIWQGGKLSPTDALDELLKLVFCKIEDEEKTKDGKNYRFQISTGESVESLFDRINSIYKNAEPENSEIFKENIKLDHKIIYNAVEHFQAINFSKTKLSIKSLAFEKFLKDFSRDTIGQHFTPIEIVEFCVKMINPKNEDYILDPSCGNGEFLLNSMNYICYYLKNNYSEDKIREKWQNFVKNNIYGIEINNQIARVCKMNLMINNDNGYSNIINIDALEKIEKIEEKDDKFRFDKFNIIITNPPFGTFIKNSDKSHIRDFILSKLKNKQKIEVLFIERCLDFLVEGGKLAIILPDGILTNLNLQYVRDFILENSEILAIVSLPPFAFNNFGSNIKSSIIFLKKKIQKKINHEYPIFMATAEHIGYNEKGQKIPNNDLDKIHAEYLKFKKNKYSY